jgi:hypothetical protein
MNSRRPPLLSRGRARLLIYALSGLFFFGAGARSLSQSAFPALAATGVQDSSSAGEEEIIFGEEEEKAPEYPSRSLRREKQGGKWMGRVNLGGYFENELGLDTVQENSQEDMIDFRSKIFGYGAYAFSDKTSLHLSILTLYWILEGGQDKQQASFDLYEGYLAFKFKTSDLYLGQMLAHWGVCNVFSPTDGVNPINYRSFIDPDSEDLKIPLPMIKADFFSDNLALEALYVPIFHSAVFQLTGADLSLVSGGGNSSKLPAGLDPFVTRTLRSYPTQSIDYQEQKFLTGEAGLKLSFRKESAQAELIYLSTREDFPAILYTAPSDIADPNAVGDLIFEFNRYELYGLTYKTPLKGVDLFTEYAYSPRRTITLALDTTNPPDGVIDKTKRAERAWQAASIELDYLDPGGNYFLKLGAERTTYINAPDKIFLSSPDTLYFLALLRLILMQGNLMPEWRVINVQAGSNQWFVSPRLKYRFQNRYDLTAGFNIFSGGGGSASASRQQSTPIIILSDNNQFFVSFRWSF